MNQLTHITLKSSNEKTGPIPVSTSSFKQCSDVCPFKRNGCYADSGPLAIHWRKVTEGERGLEWTDFIATIQALPEKQLWRHNQAGDLAGIGDTINAKALHQLAQANKGKRGFTYTHKPVLGDTKTAQSNRASVANANCDGFTVNLSGNNAVHADKLAELGIAPVVCVVPSDTKSNMTTPAGRKIVICPATQKDGVSCATCRLCSNAKRSVIIGFPSHGTSKKKADAIANA